ncbi:MAG: ABC transporter permease, partial [Candidatus Limnocylindrales bacterium]
MTAATAAGPGRASGTAGVAGRWAGRLAWYLPAVVVFVAAIGAWELAVRNIDLRGLPLPAPSAIATALVDNWSNGRWPLAKAAAATLFEAVGGLAIGTALGVLNALLTARFA